ncbi:NAD_kinase domain-containing protein [Cephalotus follicularis]|uniref:NADH kinase n=1 Tax=Cephalotus follicularis TaxID=3775 RepID=A0A1Q3AY52_CEPFO|nr:NAD_kinase domain-containing protein [Cephalotus follicularis]
MISYGPRVVAAKKKNIERERETEMARRKLLLLLKPYDVYPVSGSNGLSRVTTNPLLQVLHYLDNRRKVHRETINFCQDILRKKLVDWESIMRNTLLQPIRDVDLVVTIGGDGTLLQASHFMDDSVPILGVNSDPTQVEEVEEFSNEFDATRSTGYLCAATVSNFEQVLDNILEGQAGPSELSRISLSVNSKLLSSYALNDILIAHPCPAAVSRLSFKIKRDGQPFTTPLVHCRSSGLRVSTAAGSTAAMLSAGGFPMPVLSQDLQYMVREPILPGAASSFMHGLIKSDHYMDSTWYSENGTIYIDGSIVYHSIQHGDNIEISSKAPVLKVFLPHHLLLQEHMQKAG